jgi:hypothetical protein
MKKIISILSIFVAMGYQSQANENNTEVVDSVIVNYGKKSKIILHSDKIPGRALLNEVDGILKDLKATDENGNNRLRDTTLTLTREAGQIRVVVKENAPESPQVEDARSSDKNWNGSEKSRRYENRDKWWYDHDVDDFFDNMRVKFPLYIGFTNYAQSPNDPLQNITTFKSLNFMFGVHVVTNLSGNQRGGWSLRWGAEYSNNSLRMTDNGIVSKGANGVVFSNPSPLNVTNSRLSVTYLSIPLILRANFQKGPFKYISFGGYAGIRTGTNTIVCSENPTREVYEYTDYNVNDFRYGVRAELGLRGFLSLYGQYDLNPLFQKGKGPELNLISFGVKIF